MLLEGILAGYNKTKGLNLNYRYWWELNWLPLKPKIDQMSQH